jgi:hypothetical protein
MTKEQSQMLAIWSTRFNRIAWLADAWAMASAITTPSADNQISVGKVTPDWETPVTLNDTWGFKKDDNNWKSPVILIRQMLQVERRKE